MAFVPGTRLGSYEVIGALGAGGMGEVYLALDTKLERKVALKLLPEDFAVDPERQARFEREAKVLASLNHPNIATLYSVEHADGQHLLVMELVDGEGLDERIARGPIPLDEALQIALQIAEGLEAAHGAGIVHRDLKPANVKVRADGAVKLLDFGLAKVPEFEQGAVGATHSPTITSHNTRAGAVLGTAAYMSPEQAKGQPADRRCDIWSFGVVLWEMVTGARLFAGDSLAETLAGVLKTDVNLAALPPELPNEVRRLLRRCIERNPKERLHDFADVRIIIREVVEGKEDLGEEAVATRPAVAPRPRAAVVPWLAAIVVAAVGAGVAGYLTSAGREVPREPMRFSIRLAPNQELLAGGDSTLSFTPDGANLVMAGRHDGQQELLQRPLGEDQALPIAGTEDGGSAFISPDGRWIGFFARGSVLKTPAEGGRPFKLGPGQGAGGATWLSNDTLVVAPLYSDGLFLVGAEGGSEPERLTTPDRADGELGHWWPDPLPGGEMVVFTAFRTPVDRSRIGVLDLRTRQVRWVVEGGFYARWIPTGHLLYAKGRRLFAVPFDPERVTVTGPAVAVLDDLRVSQTSGTAMFAVSSRGTLAYVTESEGNPERELVWLDRTGRSQPAAEGRRFQSVSLSPDGRRAAVTIETDSLDLWTYDLARGTLSRLTSAEGTEFDPIWSSDGEEIFYVVDRPPFELYRIQVDAPDTGRPIWDETAEADTNRIAVAPGGRWLAFVRTAEQTGADLHVRPIDGGEPQRPFRASRAEESHPSFSPDGRWLAYQSDETGRPEIYVEAFPGQGTRVQISADGGTEPLWARGSGEIFFRQSDQLWVVETRSGDQFEFDPPRTLFTLPSIGGGIEARSYAVTADGSRILAVSIPETLVPRQVEIVTDWMARLPTLAPRSGR